MSTVIRGIISYRLLLLLCVLIIAASGSLSKSLGIHPEYARAVEIWVGGDKHLHFLASFLIGFTVTWATPLNFRPWFYNSIGMPTVIFFVMVISDEVLQNFFPTRQFSIYDLAANILGMMSGVFTYKIVEILSGLFDEDEW